MLTDLASTKNTSTALYSNLIQIGDELMPEGLLTIAETLEKLGLAPTSRKVLYRFIGAGDLTPINKKLGTGRGGTHVYFAVAEVEKLRDALRGDDEPPADKPRSKRSAKK